MKLALVLLAAAGAVAYIYRKEIVAKVQERVQFVMEDREEDPALILKDFFRNATSGSTTTPGDDEA